MMNIHPVLALDVGAIVGLIVLVLSFLGWIVNLIKGEEGVKKPQAPRQANAGGKDLRSEIQDFLDELTVTRSPQSRSARKVELDDDVVILEDEPRRQPVRAAKPEKSRKKGRPAPVSVEPAAHAKPLSQQHLAASKLGTGVQEHVAMHMASGHVAADAQRFIGNRVAEAVQQDLGATNAAKGAVPNLSVAVLHPALKFITQPGALRDAVVLSEILQPPKALRSRKA